MSSRSLSIVDDRWSQLSDESKFGVLLLKLAGIRSGVQSDGSSEAKRSQNGKKGGKLNLKLAISFAGRALLPSLPMIPLSLPSFCRMSFISCGPGRRVC